MGKFFTIKELTKSTTALKKGINNTPSEVEKLNLEKLIDRILDPLREAFKQPIIVTSGYRCEELNKAIGGAAKSQHRLGMAADIRTKKDSKEENKKLFDLIQLLNLPFDLLINEHNFDWVHVSYSDKPRKQILAIK